MTPETCQEAIAAHNEIVANTQKLNELLPADHEAWATVMGHISGLMTELLALMQMLDQLCA